MSTRIGLSKTGNTPFEKLIGHNPSVLEKWNELELALFNHTSLDANLMEQVRRTLAFGNGCEYCMVKGGKPYFDIKDQKIQTATAFAELFAVDHSSIQEAHFRFLKEQFTETEIAELITFITFITASQRFGKVMNLTEDLQENKVTSLAEMGDF
ncbi:carboxymuconolactone decarboxylase family protein [Salinimicrobium sediminilitoris]|uniref:carboxymuconolactone decarboxylase family protein n=1 Tax=Salinimicrobium sediminilitoris TaxID=2876715 RepID=UPI001E5F55F3|nr:carboxymuconolactone decarboxylase family protein [Salinimicrobium sediminilitoris]MCC8359083.1 carboxymuconolactone decarboxylase family protein [Salinimicrobium sediminilitoris]